MELIDWVKNQRTKSDQQILDADWNNSNPGYGIEPASIDEIALYCLEKQLDGQEIPIERFTPERASRVEKRRLYFLQRAMNEVTAEPIEYYDSRFMDDETLDGLIVNNIRVTRPHEALCVLDMLKRIEREAERIKPVLKELRNASKHKGRNPHDLPTPKQFMDEMYRDLLIEHLRSPNRRRARTIANKTIKLAKELYLS